MQLPHKVSLPANLNFSQRRGNEAKNRTLHHRKRDLYFTLPSWERGSYLIILVIIKVYSQTS